MKDWKVYYCNWEYGLGDALLHDDWEYETDSEEDAWKWIDEHEGQLVDDYEEGYDVYHMGDEV